MPARRVEFHPDAVVEAQAANAWYENRSTIAADAFVAELDRAVSTNSRGAKPLAAIHCGYAALSSSQVPILGRIQGIWLNDPDCGSGSRPPEARLLEAQVGIAQGSYRHSARSYLTLVTPRECTRPQSCKESIARVRFVTCLKYRVTIDDVRSQPRLLPHHFVDVDKFSAIRLAISSKKGLCRNRINCCKGTMSIFLSPRGRSEPSGGIPAAAA